MKVSEFLESENLINEIDWDEFFNDLGAKDVYLFSGCYNDAEFSFTLPKSEESEMVDEDESEMVDEEKTKMVYDSVCETLANAYQEYADGENIVFDDDDYICSSDITDEFFDIFVEVKKNGDATLVCYKYID